MADDLKNDDLRYKQYPTDSKIKRSGLNNFMSTLFGWSRPRNSSNRPDFVKVDVGSEERVGQAVLQRTVLPTGKLGNTLERLYADWLQDTEVNSSIISSRFERCQQLEYMYRNDPYVNRAVELFADEATQLDAQDTIIGIETPDPRMTRDMYDLLRSWGVTQSRVRETIRQMALYGDAFWLNKITDRGVEGIRPAKQLDVTDRLEFDPARALEMRKRKEGSFYNFSKIRMIGDMLDTMEDTDDIADLFDVKLFGFVLSRDLTVPAWRVTHFRVGADASSFAPFGESPVLGALPNFRQTQSTITLQGIARTLNFPTQIFEVTTNENMDPARQFDLVDRAREFYNNIGVQPGIGSSEVFTVNTKLWAPSGLIKVNTISPNVDIKSTDDIKILQDRTAVSVGLPKSFFSDEWYGLSGGNSGKSLIQQYKPFGRRVYTLQSAFLEGLADLFRIHFAITGLYDFRVPFTLSMKYPVEEDNQLDTKKSTLELANNVITTIKAAVGLEEEETLPPDILRDILGKYTFLEPDDIMKWTRDASFTPRKGSVADVTGGGEDFNGLDLGGGEEGGFEDLGGGLEEPTDIDMSGIEEPIGTVEAAEATPELPTEGEGELELAAESFKRRRLREKKLVEKYNSSKEDIYFKVLQESGVRSFSRGDNAIRVQDWIDPTIEPMLEELKKCHSDAEGMRFQEFVSESSRYEEED